VGAGYFDSVTQSISGGTSSITALKGSTEEEQFEDGAEEESQAVA
jgi:isocitrate lyase